jgi:DNA recombination protein RmuC
VFLAVIYIGRDSYLGLKLIIVEILWFVIGGALGILIGWLIFRRKDSGEILMLTEQLKTAESTIALAHVEVKSLQEQKFEAAQKMAKLEQMLEHMEEQQAEQESKLRVQFENLANKILEDKSQKFTNQNKTNIAELLNPLKERIQSFEKKVEESSLKSGQWNATLKQQIESLSKLNEKINQEAENLTRALKGDTKAQGNWGEFILESILEKSGLVKDREYFAQESKTDDAGRRYQPDVIVKLPDDKQLIIDSKVSLVSYERYVSAEDDIERAKELKMHIQSVRKHVKQLSEKEYQNLEGIDSLDFVLLFIPIEPAFSLAVQYDPGLFADAYERNIVVVSPTTLIATLRTIANIWKNEHQNQHALEIAKQSGNLYDKFVGFTNDLIKVGKAMDTAKGSYEDAMNKLSTGSGNLIGRVEKIKKLGAKASKSVDAKLLQRAGVDDDEVIE